MLAPDGLAFISTPANSPTLDHIYLFNNAGEIRGLLDEAGFESYSDNVPPEKAQRVKVPEMFAAFVRPKANRS